MGIKDRTTGTKIESAGSWDGQKRQSCLLRRIRKILSSLQGPRAWCLRHHVVRGRGGFASSVFSIAVGGNFQHETSPSELVGDSIL
jgi:hypothetical protein